MPQLGRTGRLLRQVQRRPHATNEDHETGSAESHESLGKHEDLNREPEDSSENEELSTKLVLSTYAAKTSGESNERRVSATSTSSKRKRPSSGTKSSKLVLDENFVGRIGARTGSATDVDNEDSGMDQWNTDSLRRKSKNAYGKGRATISTARAEQTKQRTVGAVNARFQKPPGVTGRSNGTKTSSTFKRPISGSPAESLSIPAAVSGFKMPLSVPEQVQPQRRSRRLEGSDTMDMLTRSNFKMTPSLEQLDSSLASDESQTFGVRQLINAEDAEPILHSSQADSERADLAFEDDLDDAQSDGPEVVVCPYCHNAIADPDLAYDLTSKKQMKIHEQATFCRTHRHDEAQRTWREQSYPDIDWARLPARISHLHDHLSQVIDARRPSVFRQRLSDRIAAGKDRSLLQTLNQDASSIDSFTPGYYGGKGAKIISSLLINAFAEQIREHAGRDRLIGASGVSGFVQAVLVPEVATRLIMEDMKVDDLRAVEILEESAEIGDLLFEGEEDEGALSFGDVRSAS